MKLWSKKHTGFRHWVGFGITVNRDGYAEQVKFEIDLYEPIADPRWLEFHLRWETELYVNDLKVIPESIFIPTKDFWKMKTTITL